MLILQLLCHNTFANTADSSSKMIYSSKCKIPNSFFEFATEEYQGDKLNIIKKISLNIYNFNFLKIVNAIGTLLSNTLISEF